MSRGSDLSQIRHPVITIVGPTASGKSSLSLSVAEKLNGEIISADSMQIYRYMNIGTAKVDLSKTAIKHYGIDIIDPGQSYSAQLFQEYARQAIVQIDASNHVPILCGGTGFYVQAVLEDMRFPSGEQTDNPVREKYQTYLQTHGNKALWELLNRKDPSSAEIIHPHNTRRVIRALEMSDEGIKYSDQVKSIKSLPSVVPSVRFGLKVDPTILADRINHRVDLMIENGLIDEVNDLLSKGFENALTAPQAIGYKEIVAYLHNQTTLTEAIDQIKTATRRYAKRQRSWFRRDKKLLWLDADSNTPNELAELILQIYTSRFNVTTS